MYIAKYPEKGRFSSEGIVVAWIKNPGDAVKNGDILVQIEASGEDIHFESPAEGTLLQIVADTGQFVRSGEPLAVIGQAIEKLGRQRIADSQPVQSPPSGKEGIMESEPSAGNAGNVVPILMPQAGQSMEEGTILSWKVQEGDIIEVGQVIMEIETDKATMEVEATDAGKIVRIIASEGEIVEVKKPVAFIADNAADVDTYLGGAAATAPPVASVQTSPATQASEAVVSEKPSPAVQQAPVLPTTPAFEGEVTPILMPQAGQSMEEGTILSWKVKEGDTIEIGQVIMEIETDKATMEVEAVDAGRVAKIVSQEGDIVEVKVPVAYLADESVDMEAYLAAGGTTPAASVTASETAGAPSVQPSAPVAQKSDVSVSESGRVKASPAARKAAKEKGIDLASISTGSGPGGRILSNDVETAGVGPTGSVIHPVTKMRRAIAKNLSYSKQTIPHFYAKKTIDAGLLFNTYRKTKEQFKCSVNDFVTCACAKAIRQYPGFRSQYKDTEVVENPAVNIGIAVGTDEGLTVPVVLNANQLKLEQLAAQTRQVVESARNGKLEGFGQGIFTITNLGMFGIEEFLPIINPPESAILAVGAIVEGVKVKDGQIQPTRLMTVTLSVDHRIIDGVLAAQFLNTLQELLEAPEQLIS